MLQSELICFLCGLALVNSANILGIWPTPSYGHQLPCQALAKALVARGHNLTVISPNPLRERLENYTDIDLSFTYDLWQSRTGIDSNFQKPWTTLHEAEIIADVFEVTSDAQLGSPQVQEFIRQTRNRTFDLVLVQFLYQHAWLGLVHEVGSPPIVGITSFAHHTYISASVGSPHNPAYVPDVMHPRSDVMSFWQRMESTFFYLWNLYVLNFHGYAAQERVMRKYFGAAPPPCWDLQSNISVVISSTDLTVHYAKPENPNIVSVGAIHLVPPKPLPQELKSWVDSAKAGVIYFSMGRGDFMSEGKINAFVKAFSQLEHRGLRVLWQWDSVTRLPVQPDNVKFQQWVPQIDVLAHPKVKTFISHGGIQSLQEAINFAVPVIGIPLFSDQFFNVHKLVSSGAGYLLDDSNITTKSILAAVAAVLDNPRYKENMARLSFLSKDYLVAPIHQAVWWVEYVLRHRGAPHLRPHSTRMAWYHWLLLDVAAAYSIILLIAVYIANRVYQFVTRVPHPLGEIGIKKTE